MTFDKYWETVKTKVNVSEFGSPKVAGRYVYEDREQELNEFKKNLIKATPAFLEFVQNFDYARDDEVKKAINYFALMAIHIKSREVDLNDQ